ncbi:MAG: hypothetical protein ABIN80_16600 [Dyadobacter sp.]
MRNLLVHFIITFFVLLGCKDKSVEHLEEVELPEILEPLKPLADDDLVSLSADLEAHLITQKIDRNDIPNGSIKYADIKNVDSLHIQFVGANKSMRGLEYFTNLVYLKFQAYQVPTDITNNYSWAFPVGVVKEFKPPLDTLDIRYNLKLEYLDVSGHSDGGGQRASIGFLKLGANTKLKTLISIYAMLKTMNLTGLTNLEYLNIGENYSLKEVRLCTNTKLKKLRSWQVERFYVPDPANMSPDLVRETGGATYLKCE